MADVIKVIEIDGKKYELREPAGYEVDLMITRFYDDEMKPIKEKIAEANVALIKMCYGLDEEEIKKLPNRVYRRLLAEAAEYFTTTTGGMGDFQKK